MSVVIGSLMTHEFFSRHDMNQSVHAEHHYMSEKVPTCRLVCAEVLLVFAECIDTRFMPVSVSKHRYAERYACVINDMRVRTSYGQ